MVLGEDFFADVELLNLFTLDSSQAGLKIHHEAAPERIASAKRLFEKELISQVDGGYLTPMGLQAAEHAQILIRVLHSNTED
ncbi:MAG: hypothetical protein ACJAX5_003379 [Patiriisocius sp.]